MFPNVDILPRYIMDTSMLWMCTFSLQTADGRVKEEAHYEQVAPLGTEKNQTGNTVSRSFFHATPILFLNVKFTILSTNCIAKQNSFTLYHSKVFVLFHFYHV